MNEGKWNFNIEIVKVYGYFQRISTKSLRFITIRQNYLVHENS